MRSKGRDFLIVLLFFGCCIFFMGQNFLTMRKMPADIPSLSGADRRAEAVSLPERDRVLKAERAKKERQYEEGFYKRLYFVEQYGKLQRQMGKLMLEDPQQDRRVYRGQGDRLFYGIPRRVDVTTKAQVMEDLAQYLQKRGIAFTMVSAPNRNEVLKRSLPQGMTDFSSDNRRRFLEELSARGVEVLDLQELLEMEGEEDAFYRTDTHWTNLTAQRASEVLADHFARRCPVTLPASPKYRQAVYEHSYIGSMGKRSGKHFFAEKDDYTLLLPEEETSYYYWKTEDKDRIDWEKSGSFEEVFVRKDVLDAQDEYTDRYISMMGYGTALEYIRNDKVDTGRILMIKDSFGMPLAAYLSTRVHEIYLTDVRHNDMGQSLHFLIEKLRPQQVFFVFSPPSLYYFEEMFSGYGMSQ